MVTLLERNGKYVILYYIMPHIADFELMKRAFSEKRLSIFPAGTSVDTHTKNKLEYDNVSKQIEQHKVEYGKAIEAIVRKPENDADFIALREAVLSFF
jgi:hypothetical protein